MRKRDGGVRSPATPTTLGATIHDGRRDRALLILEVHDAISAMIASEARGTNEAAFDALWLSGFAASAVRGLADRELLDPHSKVPVVTDIVRVTDLPLLVDGDTGGSRYQVDNAVKVYEGLGVAGLVIEDKVTPKQNSHLGVHSDHALADMQTMSERFDAALSARRSSSFLVFGRTEAMIAGCGVDEALKRARRYFDLGVDGLVVHSNDPDGTQIVEMLSRLGEVPNRGFVFIIPTRYPHLREADLFCAGADAVIYANQMLRASHAAMSMLAAGILSHGRSAEMEPICTPMSELLNRF